MQGGYKQFEFDNTDRYKVVHLFVTTIYYSFVEVPLIVLGLHINRATKLPCKTPFKKPLVLVVAEKNKQSSFLQFRKH